jgi:hypothetical protein
MLRVSGEMPTDDDVAAFLYAIAAIADVVRMIVKGAKGRELHFDRLSVKPRESKTSQT